MIVTIAENIFDPREWETIHAVDDLSQLLKQRWDVLPATTRIYHNYVAQNCDVTPHNEEEVDRLEQLDGHIYVIVFPQGLPVLVWVAIALAAVAIGVSFLLRPHIGNQSEASPNNDLSNRENKMRPYERIADIFGQVRAIPDLISVPYKIFIDNLEYEIMHLCVSRGLVHIDDCMDGLTPVQWINGEYVAVYAPNTSVNGATAAESTPIQTFGTNPLSYIPKAVTVQQSNAINGQVLRPPNAGLLKSKNNVSFQYPDALVSNGSGNLDFTDYFIASSNVSSQFITIYNDTGYGANASDPSERVHSVAITGTYRIIAVSPDKVTIAAIDGKAPSTVCPNWNIVATFQGQASAYNRSFNIAQSDEYGNSQNNEWVGPYVIDAADASEVWATFVSKGGLYYVDTSGNQHGYTFTVQMGVQAVDGTNKPIGSEIFSTIKLVGSSVNRNDVGSTLKFKLPKNGPCQVRAMLTTSVPPDSRDQFCIQVQWRDLFAISDVTETNFGNVTTAIAITAQTQDALSIKSRKINMLATRALPTFKYAMKANLFSNSQWSFNSTTQLTLLENQTFGASTDISCAENQICLLLGHMVPFGINAGVYNSEGFLIDSVNSKSFSISSVEIKNVITTLPLQNVSQWYAIVTLSDMASKNAADIVCAMAKDPYIGNRSDIEIDYEGIYQALGENGDVANYFGTPLCTHFGYTFDKSNQSFEEALQEIGNSTFCQFYRQGSLLSVFFEKLNTAPSLIFNHRNKIPGSETRTVTFGYLNDYDGVTIDYIDPNYPNFPNTDTVVTLFFPEDQSAVNPKKIKLNGVRNNVQATLIGWRLFQKICHQHTVTEFTATKEANLLVLNNKILVADNTRDDTQDGQVVDVTGLELTLSQNVTLNTNLNNFIFLQHINGTIEAIQCYTGSASNKVVLKQAPLSPLNTDPNSWSQGATYLISHSDADSIDASALNDLTYSRTSGFLVAEKTPHDNQTFELKAVNYDTRYYEHDKDYIKGVLIWNGMTPIGNGGYDAPIYSITMPITVTNGTVTMNTSDFENGNAVAPVQCYWNDVTIQDKNGIIYPMGSGSASLLNSGQIAIYYDSATQTIGMSMETDVPSTATIIEGWTPPAEGTNETFAI